MYNKIGDKVKVIFLDVYGVLIHNNYRNPENLHIDEEKVKILKQIVDKTNSKIVLSSTWKNSYNKKIIPNRYNVLEKILEKYNLKIYDRVPSLKPELLTKEKLQDKKYKKVTSKYDPNTRRSAEINKYLKTHDIENFLIIDDRDFDWKYFKLHKNLIKTSYNKKGLLEKHLKKAIKILNSKKERK